MEYSDDKLNTDGVSNSVDTENQSGVEADAGGISAPLNGGGERAEKSEGGFDELVGIAVKTIAVTLALVLLITTILAVSLPLQAMRVYNKLGMTERAVDFGERYITRELKAFGALDPDENGNYAKLRVTEELTNDDFIEALYVCINNSYKQMNGYYRAGDTGAGAYYAERVEKYTRMYLSLNGVSSVNKVKSSANMAAMPLREMRPLVYDYGHSMIVMNYRARAYLGDTDKMLFNSNGGDVVTTLTERTETLHGLGIAGKDDEEYNRNMVIANLDWYVDYVDALGEYLDVEFIKAGLQNDMSAKYESKTAGKIDIWTELAVKELYTGALKGDEFSLIVTKTGYTNLYNRLMRFGEYVDYAVDFKPSDSNNNKLDEMLHKLYWLQALRGTAVRIWYLNYLIYFSRDSYGQAMPAINNAYYDLRDSVKLDELTRAYNETLKEYSAMYQTV